MQGTGEGLKAMQSSIRSRDPTQIAGEGLEPTGKGLEPTQSTGRDPDPTLEAIGEGLHPTQSGGMGLETTLHVGKGLPPTWTTVQVKCLQSQLSRPFFLRLLAPRRRARRVQPRRRHRRQL